MGAISGNSIPNIPRPTNQGAKQSQEAALSLEQTGIQERNENALNYLAETVSSEAAIRELEKKRKRYLEKIEEAISLKEEEIKKQGISIETLLRDLELIAQSLAERNEELDNFFKVHIKIEQKTDE